MLSVCLALALMLVVSCLLDHVCVVDATSFEADA